MNKTFGEQFKAWRKTNKFTQLELAEVLGVNFTYISKIENGKTKWPPSEELLRKAAYHFGEDAEEMIRKSGRTVSIPIAEYERLQNIVAYIHRDSKLSENYDLGDWSQIMLPYSPDSNMQFVPRDEAERLIAELRAELAWVRV